MLRQLGIETWINLQEIRYAALCWSKADKKEALIEKDYQQQLAELFDTSAVRLA